MLEVHSVYATVRNPKPGNADDPGQITTGYYTLAHGVLTMTDSKGVAVRDLNSGEKITHKMVAGEDAAAIAQRLTMRIYRMLRGEGEWAVAGFGRAISYPASGLV
jgi:hypothetical protein